VRVIWSPATLLEILDIHNYIAADNPRAATRLADALLKLGDSLGSFPHRGRLVGDNLRELVAMSPYIIRYEVVGDDVVILRIRHGARRP